MKEKQIDYIRNHPLMVIFILATVYTTGSFYFNNLPAQLLLGAILLGGSYILGRISTTK